MINDREVFDILHNAGYGMAEVKAWMDKRQHATMRDEFAAKAMQAILADDLTPEDTAQTAYEYADAMLKERQNGRV